MNDIDLIIVTHAHDDHTAEIETIYSLDFNALKLRRKLAEQGVSDELLEDLVGDISIVDLTLSNRNLTLFGSEGSQIKFAQLLKNSWSISVTLANKKDQMLINDKLQRYGIEIDWCRADHREMPWMQNSTAISFVLKLQKQNQTVRIGFSGDTRYCERLCDLFSHLDILVMNPGSYKDPESDHLGEIGASRLLFQTTPRLVVVTEFGKELESLRDIATFDVEERMWTDYAHIPYGDYPILLPADIGFKVMLNDADLKIGTKDFSIPVHPKDVDFYDPVRKQGQRDANRLIYSERII